MRVLLMTCTYKRLDFLRFCMLQMHLQDYKEWEWIICATGPENRLSDVVGDIFDERMYIHWEPSNDHPTKNWKRLVSKVNLDNYDLFIKIDDDDIYKTDYIKSIVDWHERNKTVDVSSQTVSFSVTAGVIKSFKFQSLSQELVLKNKNVGMASSLAITRTGIKAITDCEFISNKWADKTWWEYWIDNNYNIGLRERTDNHILNIHGRNTTTNHLI